MLNPVAENAPVVDPQRAVVVSYVVTFLKPEMLHVYRQVRGLVRWRTVVLCQKREGEKAFPFDEVRVLPKPVTHQLRRWWQKTVQGGPVIIYQSEARRLREALVREGARLLHVYFGHIAVHLLPLLEMSPVPVVVSYHGADAQVDLDKPKHRAAAKRVFELAKLVLVRSDSLGERLVATGCPREKLRLNRTGIPLEGIPSREREVPADGAWRCVQASRLIAKKGLATTVNAFAKFAAKHPQARLTFAGEGPQREQLWQSVVELGIADRVNFTGFLSQHELRALYAQTHLFLHPSEIGPDGDQEGVPNAMLEAMASGVPPLATTHGGIPEAVEHGVSGLLSPERDADALAANMLALAADPVRYAAMSKAAAARIAKVFDIRATVAALEAIYDEAVG